MTARQKQYLTISVVVMLLLLLTIFLYKMETRDTTYFNYSEFDSPDQPGSGRLYMNPQFMIMLNKAREIAGIPFIVNSGYRTAAHNAEVGGEENSSHMTGHAADIKAIGPMKGIIIRAAVAAGFKRIGEGNTFIHLDNDPAKPQYAYWQYGNAPTFTNPWQA